MVPRHDTQDYTRIPVIATVSSPAEMVEAIEAWRLQERLRRLATAEHGYTPDQRFEVKQP